MHHTSYLCVVLCCTVLHCTAGHHAEQVEEAVGVVDTQIQVQEVQRLAAMWEMLQGAQEQQQQGGAQEGDVVAA